MKGGEPTFFSTFSISISSKSFVPFVSFVPQDGLIILPYRLQTEAGRGEDPRGKDTCLLGETQEGGSGAARHVSHMPENQVRRRRRSHLQLLQHPVLRTLRRKGHSTLDQGRGEIGKETAKIYYPEESSPLLALIPHRFSFYARVSRPDTQGWCSDRLIASNFPYSIRCRWTFRGYTGLNIGYLVSYPPLPVLSTFQRDICIDIDIAQSAKDSLEVFVFFEITL